MSTLQLGQSYNFEVYPAALLGNNYKNVTVVSLMDFDTATLSGGDMQAEHINFFPYLPAGTSNNPRDFTYIKIKTISGQTTIICNAWIKPETIQLIQSRTVTAKISNVGANDVARIKNALIQNGFTSIEITISQ